MSVQRENESRRLLPREQLNSLKHFQQHSRLHFIGQWKTKAHDLFKEWFDVHPGWNHGMLKRQALFAHLDMDAFFCSVVLAKDENAHLRDQPVCIAAGKNISAVSSSNYLARSFGVRAGMCVNAAKELCPNLRVLNYDLPRCEEVIKCLYSLLFELCPNLINMAVEVYSIDEVMIAFDTDNVNEVTQYCNNVRTELEKVTHCTASCGIGPNVMVARIATTMAKPNGIHVILPTDVSGIIANLPFKRIHGVGHSTIAKLRPLLRPFVALNEANDDDEDENDGNEENMVLCRHIQKLSKPQLQRALGEKAGETFYNFSRGVDTRRVIRTGDAENQHLMGKKIPTSASCSMNYAVRPETLEDVWSITSQLLEDVCSKLCRGSFFTTGLRVTLLERHPLHPKETQKFMGRGKCVEFHIPIVLDNPLMGTDFELMCERVKRTLTPILVTDRPGTDMDRANKLGLVESLESHTIWTVSVNVASDVVISDIRGISIQAAGLHVDEGSNKVRKRPKREGQQLSLEYAFSRGAKKSREKSVEVTDTPLSPSVPMNNAVVHFPFLENMMHGDVDSTFVMEWKDATRLAVQQMDYPTIKALLRVAAFRCSVGATVSRDIFTELVEFAVLFLQMDTLLYQEVQRAAHFLKEGNHNGVDSVMQVLQTSGDPMLMQGLLEFLEMDLSHPDSRYIHFIYFRLLRFHVIHSKTPWLNDKTKLLGSLFSYLERCQDFPLESWRPVISEVTLIGAIILKLRCFEDNSLNLQILSHSVQSILSLLTERTSECRVVFVRQLVTQTVSEFGLYHPAARGRNVSMHLHRACRSAFEADGLPLLLRSLLGCSINVVKETPRTVMELLGCLSSLLSWPLHNYFEEDSSESESAPFFLVSGGIWRSFLFEGVPFSDGTLVMVDAILLKWYSEASVCGLPVELRSIVELVQFFNGFRIDSWNSTERVNYGRRFLELSCHVVQDQLIRSEQYESETFSTLSLAISGLGRILENLEDILIVEELDVTCILQLSNFAKALIKLDLDYPDNDGIMAALDETLSWMFRMVNNTSRSGQLINDSIGLAVMEVLNAFLSSKLSFSQTAEDGECFVDAYTHSHMQLFGYLARLDPNKATELFCSSLEILYQRYCSITEQPHLLQTQIQETLWIVLKVIKSFLTDDCDGEATSVPHSFTTLSWTEQHPVYKIMLALSHILQEVDRNLRDASPAVISALLDVWSSFISVYTDEIIQNGVSSIFMADCTSPLTYITFALRSLEVFPFEEDISRSTSRVFNVALGNKIFHSVLQQSTLPMLAERLIVGSQRFYGSIRGEVAGFWIFCTPRETLQAHLFPILVTFDTKPSESTSLDVDLCLEHAASLIGLFVSLQGSGMLDSFFDLIAPLCDHVLCVSENRLYEKEMIIGCTEMILRIFLTCSSTLDDARTLWLIERVRKTLSSITKAITEDTSWNLSTKEEDKVRLLTSSSKLLCEVARWRMMEFDVPLHVIQPLSSCIISTLASLLILFDERCFAFPELQDSIFTAFQLCAEGFVEAFVTCSRSDVFLSTLLYALSSDSVDIQRVGTTVADTVVSFMHQMGSADHTLFSQLLQTILKGFLLGRLSLSLSTSLAKSIITISGSLPHGRAEEIFEEAVQFNPILGIELRPIISLARNSCDAQPSNRIAALRVLSEAVAESLSNIKGRLLT